MDLQEGEVAVEIDGFPGYYITSRGRVWTTKSNRWMKPTQQRAYYYTVGLTKEGKTYNIRIHRLVGLYFLPIINIKGAFICHKDETLPLPEINFVENLWVGNNQQNLIDCEEKGRGQRGRTHSEETRRKLREYNKGKVMSLESRRKMSEANKGKVLSQETKRKLSESLKGRKHSSETRKRMSESHKGKVKSPETRKRMSEAAKNRKKNQIL